MHGLVVLAFGLLFSAPSLEDVNRAVKNVLADSGIQTEYPGGEAEPPPPEDRASRPPERPRSRPPVGAGGSAILSTVLWVLVGVVAALLVFWAVREFKGYVRPVRTEEAVPVATPHAPPAEAELGDAEALAEEGRYDDAVHVLLLRALRSLETEGSPVSSNTSREVIGAAALEHEAREAVTELVRAVELSLFGGRPAGEAGYRASVDHYRRFQATRA